MIYNQGGLFLPDFFFYISSDYSCGSSCNLNGCSSSCDGTCVHQCSVTNCEGRCTVTCGTNMSGDSSTNGCYGGTCYNGCNLSASCGGNCYNTCTANCYNACNLACSNPSGCSGQCGSSSCSATEEWI